MAHCEAVRPSSTAFLLKVALPRPQLPLDSVRYFPLQTAVVLNLLAEFRHLVTRHVEGATPALLLPIKVEQRTVLMPALATAAGLAADHVLFNQRSGQQGEVRESGVEVLLEGKPRGLGVAWVHSVCMLTYKIDR